MAYLAGDYENHNKKAYIMSTNVHIPHQFENMIPSLIYFYLGIAVYKSNIHMDSFWQLNRVGM